MSKSGRQDKRSSICGQCTWLEKGPQGPGGYVVVEKSGAVNTQKGHKSQGLTEVSYKPCPRCKGLGDPFQGRA